MFRGELEQRRSFLSQILQIKNFVVRGAGLPTLPDDPDPFESQGADRGVMVFAFGALHSIVSAGPEGFGDRLGGELMKGLPQELGGEGPLGPTSL